MDDWVSELMNMEWDNEYMILNNEHFMQFNQPQPQPRPRPRPQPSIETFSHELALLLEEDLPSPPYLSMLESNDEDNYYNSMPRVCSSLSIIATENNPPPPPPPPPPKVVNQRTRKKQGPHASKLRQKKNIDEATNEDPKRRRRTREPEQIHEHILAERRRRGLLTELFITLAGFLPGLKKVDKTTVLKEAIKHLEQQAEKMKKLEEAVAKHNEESIVIVKRSKMLVEVDDDDSSSIVDDHSGSGSGGGGDSDFHTSNSIPEIEVKVLNKTILLRLYCENNNNSNSNRNNNKGISSTGILTEVENHGLDILHSSVSPFEHSGFSVTIVARAEKIDKKHVENLVKNLHFILQIN